MSKPSSSPSPLTIRRKYCAVVLPVAHGAIAPSVSERSSSGMTSDSSTLSLVPIPSHAGQAPNGELNEKVRGSISSRTRGWSLGHRRFSE